MKPIVTAVVTDLDNTLYDWVGAWGAAFEAMMRALADGSGVPRETLEREARVVHQAHRTTEYSRLLQELPSLRRMHPGGEPAQIYAGAIRAYREARAGALRLFPSVRETLEELRNAGCLLVGFTDSRALHCGYRVRTLGLDGLLDVLYSPPDHAPATAAAAPVAAAAPGTAPSAPRDPDALARTAHRHTAEGELKPNPRLLAQILRDVGADPAQTIYVGDSLMKDIAMAQQAGVTDVFARYGTAQHREEYELLRRVSHWTDEDIERERRLAEAHVSPTHVLSRELGELLDLFRFEPLATGGDLGARRGSGSRRLGLPGGEG